MEKFLHKNEFLATEKFLNSFKIYLKFVKNYSDNTIKSYLRDLMQFYNFIKETNVNKIDKNQILSYLIHLHELNLNKKSINRKISAIKGYFRYLTNEKYIHVNPAEDIGHYKVDKKTPVFLNYDEIKNLLDFDSEDEKEIKKIRDNAIIELLYSTGLRVSELVSLNIENINFEENLIKVKGKGAKERIVIFGNHAKEKLKKYLNYRNPIKLNDPLFVNLKGKRLTPRAIQIIVKERAKKCGITKKVTPHVLRHTFATHLLSEGMDLRMIQQLLGHSNLATTQIYTQIGIKKLIEIYDRAHPKGGS